MAWRLLHVSNPSFLHLKEGKVVIKQREDSTVFPIEDISCIVLDHPQVTVSVPLLSRLAAAKVVVLICGEKHVPSGVYMPYAGHSRPLESFYQQQKLSLPQKKILWQTFIKAKVRNQAKVIENIHGKASARGLFKLVGHVRSGDADNVESTAAKQYWKALFGEQFLRSEDSVINTALNYGYALIRSLLIRSLSACGYYLPLGLHHKNKLNPFNLADDFIEPFRPFVDKHVFEMQLRAEDTLSPSHKQTLTQVLQAACRLNKETFIVLNACEKITESFYRALRFQTPLCCPEVP